MTELSAADQEIMRLATEADDAPEAKPEAETPANDNTLELGGEDAPEVKDDEEKKSRNRPWSKRVDILTAQKHDLERRLAEAEAKLKTGSNDNQAPATVEELETKRPDPNAYEFGEADPKYIDALTDWKLDVREARSRQKSEETKKQTAEETARTEAVAKLSAKMEAMQKTAAEKYPDFEEKIAEALDARGGEPLSPLVSVGIASSPVGADLAYRLATDNSAAERIEKAASSSVQEAAMILGELEGEYLGNDDSDLNISDPLDMVRMLGRMKARLAGNTKPVERKTSKAPEPPENRSRGAGGKFEVGDDTEDFAAFERKYSPR